MDYTINGAITDLENALLEFDKLLDYLDYSLIDDGLGSVSTINTKALNLRNKLNEAKTAVENSIVSMKRIDYYVTGNK